MKRSVILFSVMGMSMCSYGAGFNCAKAGTWVEKTICADAQLSQLDEQLMTTYKKALSTKADSSAVKTAQRSWLQSVRNACQDVACLKQAYSTRLAELKEPATSNVKLSAIAGEYERYYRGKLDTNAADIRVRVLPDGQVHVEGDATWVGNVATGNVHVGELAGTFRLNGNKIYYTDGDAEGCRLTIAFAVNALSVSDDNLRCGGMNVSFDGQYRKTK